MANSKNKVLLLERYIMKHAYLIIAHKDPEQIQFLISLLDYEHNDIYLHIDKKNSQLRNYNYFARKSSLYIFSRYSIFWGTYDMVECEIMLLKAASKKGYDFYHLISGEDLPTKRREYIHHFFEIHRNNEFVDFSSYALKNNAEIRRRTRFYHFFTKQRLCHKTRFVNGIFKVLERICIVLQMILRVDRDKKNGLPVSFGSQWFSISKNLAKRIVHNEQLIRKKFRFVHCPDEMFVQTILGNSKLIKNLYTDNNTYNNMRYIIWNKKGAHPIELSMELVRKAVDSDCLFMRKVNIINNPEIKGYLTNILM